MINSWSLLYDELYGDDEMTDDNRITPQESDEYDPKPESNAVTPQESDEYDIPHSDSYYDYTRNDPNRKNPFTDPKDRERAFKVTGNWDDVSIDPNFNIDTFSVDTTDFTVGSASTASDEVFTVSQNYDTLNISIPDVELPTPGIEKDCTRKYKEDESIEALKNYISTTYGGHYTSNNNNVQTLDLIESVGDAESFCRSNAIKYLSRYDKKGQAKRDILKALHYTLLLYHFSGQLNETQTRGYETF